MTEQDRQGEEIVRRYAMYAAGAGLIPIPLVDFAAITGIEVKMLHELGEVYGVPFEKDRVRPIVSSLLGGYMSTRVGYGFGGGLIRAIPVVGQVLGAVAVPGFAAGFTWAIGRVFIQHFASGGTFLDFDPAKVRAYFKSQKTGAAA